MKDAERKALLWATDYFRDYKPRDKKQEKQAAEEWRSLVIRRYDACRGDQALAGLVSALAGTGGYQGARAGGCAGSGVSGSYART